ncbi:sulfotransferase family 2 domain-containing protein [Aurantiacibacter sediminis]|uniref:Sulfotransferase family 2 domain-containing protein n=1 Tax=Aurantiacibacter sediminis TaxID=2793064 RepID=A0ABS0N1N6_9SPHN|nr:sulfotransferase family 2 domain-containing protein [Aurantiacibacter sediminis]MBH5321857.1 sulfotransferase family 2 domain-containing protein [Aurantiacibacter sediminis]
MLLSFDHKLLFVAIPKTGSHAVRHALRPLMGDKDWEQCRLFDEKQAPLPSIAQFGHGHLTAAELRVALGPKMFDGFFSFAVVRDPFDRFVSLCAFMSRKSGKFEADPRDHMHRVLDRISKQHDAWSRPQSEYVFAEDGEQIVSHVARYESLQNEIDAVRARAAARPVSLERINTSARRDAAEYYDEELTGKVAAVYADDIANFGFCGSSK